MAEARSPIGENLARIRKARGRTQEELAARSGVSVDVIARLEQGRKKGARWSTLIKLANALGVDLVVLVAPAGLLPQGNGIGNGDLTSLRQAITTTTDLFGEEDLAEDQEVPSLPDLRASVNRAWASYQNGEFALVSRLLPGLIGDARRATREWRSHDVATAHTLLATAYNMAAGITVMLGHQDLAFTAVERAAAASRAADGPLPAAASMIFLSWILLKQGRYQEAERVALSMAERSEPSFTSASRTELATFGNLMVNASCAVVRTGNGERASDHLSVARAAASRYGVDRVDQWSVFGPRVVGMYYASNAVELADIEQAVRLAEEVPPPSGGALPPTWEARYLLNMAYAHSELGNDTETVNLLWQARQIAPEWVRYHPLSATIVMEQLERPRKPSERLALLAEHLRVL